MTSLIN